MTRHAINAAFLCWAIAIAVTAGSYLLAIWPEFYAKIVYLAAWKIVAIGVAPQAVACLKLASLRALDNYQRF